MNILERLNAMKDHLFAHSSYQLSYKLEIDNNEIIFSYDITRGWEVVAEHYMKLNACDFKTNYESLVKEINEIHDKWVK